MKGSSDLKIREVGDLLENLRLARIKSDYKLDARISKVQALDEYLNATDLRDEIKRYGVANLAATVKTDLENTFSPPL